MKWDCFELLYKIVRIANCAIHDYPRGLKDILGLVAKSFPSKTGVLLLLAPEGDRFDRRISTSDDELLVPCNFPRDGSPEDRVLLSQQIEHLNDTLYVPVCCCHQAYGVFVLSSPETEIFSPRELECLAAIGGEFAFLSRNVAIHAEEAWRMEQLAFLSDLGRQLTQAHQLKELLSTACKSIHRHSQAACVILRPLIGGTVIGSSYLRLSSAYRKHRALLQQIEEEHAPKALNRPTPLYLSGFVDPAQVEDGVPAQMVVVPLFFQHRAMGTLSLFFPQEMVENPFATKGATKEFYTSVGSQIAHAMERVSTLERLESLSGENDLKFRELSLLYHSFRAIHSTLNLNELMHLILSVATVPDGGGFERAMLFTINERSGMLQGMLGVSQDSAALIFPVINDRTSWENPSVSTDVREAQRLMPFCQQVMRQRLPLDAEDNALARAVNKGQVVFVSQPSLEPPSGAALAKELHLGPYVCAPLRGKNRPLGVLVMDSVETNRTIGLDRLRFLELFAHQASSAMENSLLLQRLETVNRDLRETHERLSQGEKMAALGELAASIAHELKTPLVTIGGFAQRLNRQITADSKEAEYCDIIVRETRRMEKILSEILAFSKKQLFCFSECRVEDLFDQALALVDDPLKKSHVEVSLALDDNLPTFQGDEQRLLQVLINIIDNARQSMDEGGVLTLRAKLFTLYSEPAIAIEIQDTGCGVPIEAQKEIFTPFFTTKDQGTGLGLAISQRIIQQHRGSIGVHSDPSGSIFTIRLPLKAALVPHTL
jgi:two-component system, NtrC family, sensor histidine kinase HydH